MDDPSFDSLTEAGEAPVETPTVGGQPTANWPHDPGFRLAIEHAMEGMTGRASQSSDLFGIPGAPLQDASTPIVAFAEELVHSVDPRVVALAVRRRRAAPRTSRSRPHANTPVGGTRVGGDRVVRGRVVAGRAPSAATVRRSKGRVRAAMLMVTAVLAAGGVWLAETQLGSHSPAAESTIAQPALPPVPPLPADGERWAADAKLTLAAVDGQIAKATSAETAWRASAASRHDGSQPPKAVRELQHQVAMLRQDRAKLQSAVDAWRAASDARAALMATAAQYDALAHASAAPVQGPTIQGPTVQGAATTVARPTAPASRGVASQRQALAAQAAVQRHQLDTLLPQVRTSVTTPMPMLATGIDSLLTSVLGLTHKPPPAQRQATGGAPAGTAPTGKPATPPPGTPSPTPARTTTTAPTAPPAPGTAVHGPPAPPTVAPIASGPGGTGGQSVPPIAPSTPTPVRPASPPAPSPVTDGRSPTIGQPVLDPVSSTVRPPVANGLTADELRALRYLEAMSVLAAAADRATAESNARRPTGQLPTMACQTYPSMTVVVSADGTINQPSGLGLTAANRYSYTFSCSPTAVGSDQGSFATQ